MKKRLGSILLCLALAFSLLPWGVPPARADGNEPAQAWTAPGMSAVAKGDKVWFGLLKDSPAAWRVLSAAGDATLPVSGAGRMLLLSERAREEIRFNSSADNNKWAGSAAQAWCGSLYSNWPAPAEKAAIAATSVAETKNYTSGNYTFGPASLNNERFFFLSAEEVVTYLEDPADRKPSPIQGNTPEWVLRSPYNISSPHVGKVQYKGSIDIHGCASDIYARPAFNLDPAAVVLATAAAGGKDGVTAALAPLPENTTGEWKLTLRDPGRDSFFAVTSSSAAVEAGDTVQLNYSGAETGENEYVSVLLYGAGGAALGYGSVPVVAGALSSAEFTLPDSLKSGEYTLRVFNEQRNGDKLSDCAGNIVELPLTVKNPVPFAAENGDAVWFGKESGENGAPIAWRVLSAFDDAALPVSGPKRALLISEHLRGMISFAPDWPYSDAWAESAAQTWCGTLYSNWPAGAEKAAIAATSVTETESYTSKVIDEHGGLNYGPASLSNEHFFFLSAEEAETYFNDDGDRIAYAPDDAGGVEDSSSWWWLRSSLIAPSENQVGSVDFDGWLNVNDVRNEEGARPAFNLDPAAVLLGTAAVGGKAAADGTLAPLPKNTTHEWKLTLLDAERTGFGVTKAPAPAAAGGTVSLTYSGAQTGGNEYVSALLLDAGGAALGYGSVPVAEDRKAAFTLPDDLTPGAYTLRVFNERRGGNYESDCAGNIVELPLTVVSATDLAYAAVGGLQAAYAYTGAPIDLAYTVTSAGGVTLRKGMDYAETVSPSPVRSIGTYTLTVTGAGDYSGTLRFTFQVHDAMAGMNAAANGDTVWFGRESGENGAPIAWRVLSAADDETLPVSDAAHALLVSTKLWDMVQFDTDEPYSNVWTGSAAQEWCEAFCDGWPAGAEKNAIAATSVNETMNYTAGSGYAYSPAPLNDEHFFFLSAEEADTYFADDNDRKAETLGAGSIGEREKQWWLRSPYTVFGYVGYVLSGQLGYNGVQASCRARPACNLDAASVLLATAAVGGKDGVTAALAPLPENTTGAWKLTLPDAGRTGFAVTEAPATAETGGTVELAYSGAQTGGNEYVSALLLNADGVTLGYASVPVARDGAAAFTLPDNLTPGAYTLRVFNEQRNGDKLSDYAGNAVELTLTVKNKVDVKGDLSSGKLVATVTLPANANALLIAASYDGTGRQADAKVIEVENGKTTYETGLTKTSGHTYRLMLVDGTTFAPLCKAWDSANA